MLRLQVGAYLALRSPKVMLRHDELYDEEAVRAKLDLLTSRHGIARRPGLSTVVYPNFTASTGNNNHDREFTRAEFDAARDYERDQHWVSSYSQADLDFVNSQLDPAQERAAMRLPIHLHASRHAPGATHPPRTNPPRLNPTRLCAACRWPPLASRC